MDSPRSSPLLRLPPALVLAAIGLLGAWTPPAAAQELGTLVSPGPLSAAHAKLEGLKNCAKCHEPGKKVTARRCLACHQPIAERVAARKGVHRDVGDDCVTCHVEHAGADAELRPLDPSDFDHAKEAGYPLDGRHAAISRDCAKCHTTRSYLAARPECASCHKDVHKGALGNDCARCHSTVVVFAAATNMFDHTASRFPLTGAHSAVPCAKCHVEKAYKGLKFGACSDCHADPHKQRFGADCASCHTTAAWRTNRVDHSRTRYPLEGRHATVPCASCHTQPAMQIRPDAARCASCHQDVHRGAFTADCAACHTVTSFKGAPFDHAAKTKFALTGKHAATACVSCHKQARGAAATAPAAASAVEFRGLRSECASCHSDVHKGELGSSCASCHSTATFAVTTFAHPRSPEFFAGGHAAVACVRCHAAPDGTAAAGGATAAARKFRGVSFDCASCHKDVHLGQLGGDCARCHSIAAPRFAAPGFSHAAARFPLAGKHAAVACASCHKSETAVYPDGTGTAVHYTGISHECASCHKDVHLGQLGNRCESCHGTATFALTAYTHKGGTDFFVASHAKAPCLSCHKRVDGVFPAGPGTAVRFAGVSTACASCHQDPHTGKLGTDCSSCHTAGDWRSASRAFHKGTAFPLLGAHQRVPCSSCHTDGDPADTPNRCYDCHWVRKQDDRFETRLGNECETCHNTTAWASVTWSHASQTGFPLNTAHAGLDCESCHAGGVFVDSPPADCISCHRNDFESATVPPHVSGGFPTDCTLCHTAGDTTWTGGSFEHAAYFELAGAHAAQPCESCHTGGVFAGTSRECIGCHQQAFVQAGDPEHAAAGFSTDCATCHQAADASWDAGRYAHTTWPLQGAHVAPSCATCHSHDVYAGMGTACISCHQADYQAAAQPNHAAAGFPTVCQPCHQGSHTTWAQAVFDHAAAFPLQGVHAGQACVACHAGGVFAGTARECVGCHLAAFESAADPSHAAAGFSTACESCHLAADASWDAGRYDHATWPLRGAHVAPDCATCHTHDLYAGMGAACVTCHQAEYQAAVEPVHAAAGFPTACETCHGVADASWDQGTFDHEPVFRLQGVHAAQSCVTCHAGGVFAGTERECVGCHLAAFESGTDPSHVAAGFSTACESCHLAADASWDAGRYEHAAWPIQGAHVAADCATCHTHGVYTGTGSECVDCHRADYQAAAQPVHAAAGFPTACETCHLASHTAWDQGVFDHNVSFPLQGIHASQVCSACHVGGVFEGTARECAGCHQTDYDAATHPNHVAAGFLTACETCHTATDSSWDLGNYTHTVWPLQGAHVAPDCATCHAGGVFSGMGSACVSCHQTDYQTANEPNHLTAGFPTVCETCHKVSDTTWDQGVFDHDTSFPLVGMHAAQQCAACHAGSVFQGTPRDCAGCHTSEYQSASNPNHVAAGFLTACETCHNAADASWDLGSYTHTGWPLQGAHVAPDCATCHSHNVYAGMGSACVTCHLTAYQTADTPNHLTAGFPTVCETCHKVSDTNWDQGVFDHDASFPLVGTHALKRCAACHAGGVFEGTARECAGCHTSEYQTASNPNHVAAGFLTACETCHNAADASWDLGSYTHTGWPLQGAHVAPDCATCHSHNVYAGMGSACVSCHLTDYQTANEPNHVTAGFPTLCETCHKVSDTTWDQGVFDHDASFPLVGVHAAQQCAACHANGIFQGTARECAGCHQTDFDAATDPNHVAAGFLTACETCHNAADASWDLGRYTHTGWPLQGAHVAPDCATCHVSGVFSGMGSACVSCHLTDYQTANEPNHVTAGFPTVCETCHKVSDTTWDQGVFDHDASFPLVGVHAAQQCAACHANGVFQGTARECAGCHQTDFDAATDPNHVAAGFLTACETCHNATDASWDLGRYTHTGWPLQGAHIAPDCATCHSHNVYAGMGAACVTCHLTDYQTANEPNHVTAGFPTRCETCHKVSDTTWDQGVFDHDASFPLVGVHAAQQCAACHANGIFQGTARECAGCHQTDFDAATDPNHVAAGFLTACETCHNAADASWDLGRYTHTAWPLQGAHVAPDCATCHAHNVYAGMGSACVSCHLTDYQNADEPNHITAGFPTVCETCHRVSDTNWDQGVFDHNASFPLVGVHAAQQCAACHAGSIFQGTPRDCVGCHTSDYRNSRHPDHAAAGFANTCESCHDATDATWHEGRYTHASWPLQGAHVRPDCALCHPQNVFVGMGAECISCHNQAYHSASNPNHRAAGFPTACEICHRVSDTSWDQGVFDHNASFPLVGVHAAQQCAACHANGIFQGTARECAGCHQTDYDAATNPNHLAAGFLTACETCHNAVDSSWDLGRYAHTVWPLQGAHVAPDCATCHSHDVYSGMGSECMSCHQTDYQSADEPNHLSAGFPTTCETCHKVSDASWDQGVFDHNASFPLVGVHAAQVCNACHSTGIFQGTPRECAGCHTSEYQSASNPNHLAAGFLTDCETCHNATDASWDLGRYTHTVWPLQGAHVAPDCATCHSHDVYAGMGSECMSCHQTDYQNADEPNHLTAGFPTACETCHRVSDTSWDQGVFDHNASFPLVGVHALTRCADCHAAGVFQGTPRDCAGCHQTDFDAATNPNHLAAGFVTACETCHNAADASWDLGRYTHTAWPLQGAHVAPDCATCHSHDVYAGMGSACVSCHLTDYQTADEPNHLTAGFPTVCETCHKVSDTSWDQGVFDHNASFPLLGVHAQQSCADCHAGGVFQGTPRDCAGCHTSEYQSASNPNHVAAGFLTACETCHNAADASWDLGRYTHTAWPLQGAHVAPDCATCHSHSVYAGMGSACVSCHLTDYQTADEPNHLTAGFPTACETCHKVSDTSWDQGVFDHNASFPLLGVHALQSCADCHIGGVYQGTPRQCAGCHTSEYQSASNPNHVAAGFLTACETCHMASDASWDLGRYPHTVWRLQGAHVAPDCSTCHSHNVYAGMGSACVSCHLSDYQGTSDPNHTTAGFSTACESCHRVSDTSWDQGVFDHNATFPLLGMHAAQPCSACHTGGVYRGTPRECAGCHLGDYQSASDPNHITAGFPTTCDTCHRAADTSWDQGVFTHTWFPITSGAHRGFECSECHTTPSSFAIFSCTTACHPRSETDRDHDEEPGYRYDSNACYSCHPNGKSD